MSTVSIIVATFGPDKELWDKFARRAIGSVVAQTKTPTEFHRVHVPEPNALHVARNRGAAMSASDFLIYLDADDQLHPNYVEAMLAGEGDVRIPNRERFYWDGRHDPPDRIKPPAGGDLLRYSHILIGAMVRRELFLEVGGFEDWPIWEDWHFWIKCWLAGASMLPCPEAIYQVHVRLDSRNQQRGNMGVAAKIRLKMEPLARAKCMMAEQKNAGEIKRRLGMGVS